MQLSLDQDKLGRILSLVLSWRSKHASTKRELKSLIGHLSHAATVVQHGRTFLRQMIDLSKQVRQPHHHITTYDCHRSFGPISTGGHRLCPGSPCCAHRTHSMSSRQMPLGHGDVVHQGDWFQLQWPQSWEVLHIAAKELVPVVMAVAVWGASCSPLRNSPHRCRAVLRHQGWVTADKGQATVVCPLTGVGADSV